MSHPVTQQVVDRAKKKTERDASFVNNPLAWLEEQIRKAPYLDPQAMASGGSGSNEMAARIGSNFLPIVGDMAGLAQDAEMYLADPESRTPGNYLLSSLGLLPFVPTVASIKRSGSAAKKMVDSLTARGFKTVAKTGRFIGSPEWIKSPKDVIRAAEEYAARVEAALDAGVDPNYFYRNAADAIRKISPDPKTASQMGSMNALTSSEAPVRTNFGWATKAFEQNATGHPIYTGKYPNTIRDSAESILRGEEWQGGIKTHRYGQGISGVGRQLPEEMRRAPNDRFEIRSLGFGKDTASPEQHYFIDRVRQMAMEMVNQRRGLNLDIYNTQELNWATMRADEQFSSGVKGWPKMDDKTFEKIRESSSDNIQDSLNYYTMQHSWETVPGIGSGHLPGVDLKANDAALKGIMVDPSTGRDRLIDAMGGTFQQPAFSGPGVFQGQVHPYGHQSRSLVYHAGGQLDPASADRIRGTEMVRSYMLGQDAGAASLSVPSKRKSLPEFGGSLMYDMGGTISPQQAQNTVDVLTGKYGYGVNDFGIVPTAVGANIISTGAKNLHKASPDINPLLSVSDPDIGLFGGTGFYAELPWQSRSATQATLDSLTPAMRLHADSDSTRLIAGQIADYYSQLEKTGGKPIPGLRETLEAWATRGLAGVEDLVKKGVAPAAVLAIASQAARQQREEETSPPRAF